MASPTSPTLPLEDQLAAVSGIVTPSKALPGQKPRRPIDASTASNDLGEGKICIVCGSFVKLERVKHHFVACMNTNGNPMGAQWWHNFIDGPKHAEVDESYHSMDESPATEPISHNLGSTLPAPAKSHQSDRSIVGAPMASTQSIRAFAVANEAFASTTGYCASAERSLSAAGETFAPVVQPPAATSPMSEKSAFNSLSDLSTGTSADKAEQSSKDAERLAAVNGVVIPSRVAPGNRPHQGKTRSSFSGIEKYMCNICGRGFQYKNRISNHFPGCVDRNGNPYGLKWDDPYTSSDVTNVLGELRSAPARDTPFSRAPSPSQRPISNSKTFQSMEYSSPHTVDRVPSVFIPSKGSSPTVPQPAPPTIAERELAMGRLSNVTLLNTLQAWQNTICAGQEAYARNQPGFQDVMTELEERRLVDGNWVWTVNDFQIDKAFVRLVGSET